MPLHQSEVITYTQADEQLRRRVRALIAREHALAKRPPDPEIDLDRIMWPPRSRPPAMRRCWA